MTFEQLEYFVAIVEYKNFSVAAEECFISQSSLSKHMKALEKELNVRLLDRNTRRLELTLAGENFYIYAVKLLAEYSQMLKSMKKFNSDTENILYVGAIPVLNHYGLTDIFFYFQQQYPKIKLKVTEQNSNVVVELFVKKEIDIAFIRDNYLPNGDYYSFPLIKDELVLITEAGHQLAEYDEIDLRLAENEEFLMLGLNTGMYQTCVNTCKRAGFVPKERTLDLRSRTIKNLVANGQGVSLMMLESMKYMDDPRIKIIHLKDPVIVNLCMVVRKDVMTDALQTFIEYVKDSFDKLY